MKPDGGQNKQRLLTIHLPVRVNDSLGLVLSAIAEGYGSPTAYLRADGLAVFINRYSNEAADR